MISGKLASMIELTVFEVVLKVKDMQRLYVWEDFREYILWRELSSCILGSRVPFELARSSVRRLDRTGLLRILQRGGEYATSELLIRRELQKPLYSPLKADGSRRSYTFPNVRSRQLRLTAEAIYGTGRTLKELLGGCNDEYCARQVVADFSAGVGPKQASLFLRNIGFADNLAILDTHVLRFMEIMKLLKPNAPQPSTFSAYEKTETKLQMYADRMKAQMACLDTAIWIVMRVYQKEFSA